MNGAKTKMVNNGEVFFTTNRMTAEGSPSCYCAASTKIMNISMIWIEWLFQPRSTLTPLRGHTIACQQQYVCHFWFGSADAHAHNSLDGLQYMRNLFVSLLCVIKHVATSAHFIIEATEEWTNPLQRYRCVAHKHIETNASTSGVHCIWFVAPSVDVVSSHARQNDDFVLCTEHWTVCASGRGECVK